MKSVQPIFYKLLLILFCCAQNVFGQAQKKPNILFCIFDDASFQHMSAYGLGQTSWVKTPGFDKVAAEGLLFNKAYTPNAKCAPSRASILTGRNSWQLEAAGNHNPYYPEKFKTFIELLGENGYATGHTGKGWAPGNPGMVDGKPLLLTGKEYNEIKMKVATSEISPIDYASNLEYFLKQKPSNQPFCFWVGSKEPHREYEYGSGSSKGKKDIKSIPSVPPFWIDNDTIRNDMLDYAFELEHFDAQLLKILDILEKRGELDNTIVVVTSDNGMPFPRVKGHMYDYDNHLPLAVMWKKHIPLPGRKVGDFISFIDFAPTFLKIAEVNPIDKMQPIQGKSFTDILYHKVSLSRDHILLGREREDVGRPMDEGYPVRAIVKGKYFYTKNYEPNRWPSGNPETGYMDTDGSPTKTVLLSANRMGLHKDLWQMSFGKNPAEELYQTDIDPFSLNNLANDPKFTKLKLELRNQMESELRAQKDPRMLGNGIVFDKYPYSEKKVINFYERFLNGEKIKTGWINDSDFEKPGFIEKNNEIN